MMLVNTINNAAADSKLHQQPVQPTAPTRSFGGCKVQWAVAISAAVGCVALFFAVGVSICYLKFAWENAQARFDKLPELRPVPESWRILTLPEMHIRSCHNSYIASIQHASLPTTTAVERALQMGDRAIELDTRLAEGGFVWVAHGTANVTTTGCIRFSEALQTIRSTAFSQLDDPLLLFLELSDPTSDALATAVGIELEANMGALLHRFAGSDHISNVTIDTLRGKALVFANSQQAMLEEIVVPREQWINMGSQDPNALQPYTGNLLARIFPSAWFSLLSVNIDAIPFMASGYGSVAMNFAVPDNNLYQYL